MLFWLIFLPLLGGLAGWLFEVGLRQSFTQSDDCKISSNHKIALLNKLSDELCSFGAGWVALLTMFGSLLITVILSVDALLAFHDGQEWIKYFNFEWIPLLGIRFRLMVDSFSLLMILLTIIIVMIAILYSRKENHSNSGLFSFCILLMTSAAMILFTARNLFLLFFVWEAIVIPIYFLITLWGGRDSNAQLRFNGAAKFLICSQISSLLMLISIISLALANWKLTNQWTFNYDVLMKTPISSYMELLLMLGFLIAFIVRIPLVPFHGWYIDAHVESSTTGSIMISGVLVNTAIYGLFKFVIPLFPNASLMVMPIMQVLTVLTLFYSALVCFNQNDIKRLIAYAHIALMSIVTAVIYSGSLLAYQGVILQIIAISLAITGLFIISGLLVERYFTRNITQFFGIKTHVKFLSTLTLFYILAILGIPGTANFVGNFMMLFGSFDNMPYSTFFLIMGLLLLSISIITRLQPIFYGVVNKPLFDKKPVSSKDLFLLVTILSILLFVGLYPQLVLDMSCPTVNKIQQVISNAQTNLIKGGI